MFRALSASALLLFSLGCSPAEPPGRATSTTTLTSSSRARVGVDAGAVGRITGVKPELAGDVVKVSFPRTDVPVEIDGWRAPPFMGLTSWAGFSPSANAEAMVMGDFVLFEDEVNPVMSAALDGGLEVTALHNHFFFDKPRVYFMHIAGEGAVDTLANVVKGLVDVEKGVRQRSPQPATGFASTPAVQGPSKIDGAKLDAIFGVSGVAKDGMYKAVMGRKTTMHGQTMGGAMGVNTWSAFAGTDESAVVDGDFAVSEPELQPVLKSLRGAGINIVAIHSHMTGEEPRTLFLHYWGRGPAADLARSVRLAVDLTAWDGRTQSRE